MAASSADGSWDASKTRAVIAEFIGSLMFLFILITGASISALEEHAAETLSIAICAGLALAVSIYVAAPVSGGHLNPAVTFAMMISQNIDPVSGIAYVVVQVFGAYIGAEIADAIVGHHFAGGDCILHETLDLEQGFFAETVGTFILTMVVFSCAVQPSAAGEKSKAKETTSALAPLLIGLCVSALHIALVPMTGAGLNPARVMATSFTRHSWDDHWLYWFGPLFGAALAVGTQFAMHGAANAKGTQSKRSDVEDSQV